MGNAPQDRAFSGHFIVYQVWAKCVTPIFEILMPEPNESVIPVLSSINGILPHEQVISARVLTAEWVLPVSSPPIYQGYLCIAENGRILSMGKLSERSDLPFAPSGTLLSPGLINTHLHLEQSFPAPIPKQPDTSFSRWLLDVVAHNRQSGSTADKMTRCRFGAAELLRTGTTCVNDIASGPESLEVLDTFGLRGIVSLECFHPAGNQGEPLEISKLVDAYRAFSAEYERHPRLQTGLSPHSLYNVSLPAWEALREACQPPFIHSHVAEWNGEMAYFRDEENSIDDLHETLLGRRFAKPRPTRTPIQHLNDWDLLDSNTLLAHAIHTTAEDRALLAARGTAVAHCPRSNVFLHGDTFHWADWSDSGVKIALGTDGRLSVNDLDLRGEARAAMHRHGWDARQTLEMLTCKGASALNLCLDTGALEVGMWADCVLWQCTPAIGTVQDGDVELLPEEKLLAESTQVSAVYIAGVRRWPHQGNDTGITAV